jgi:SAM-dependent methyltransferase
MEPGEYDNIARLESQHWWYVGMRRIAESLLQDASLGPHAQILDAGCGTGGGLQWLSAFGAATGIDWHPFAVRYASSKSRRVARASVQAIPFPDGFFDLVTSFEVLYHLAVTDDTAALREFARVLRPGGQLLVRVPAHDWLRGAHDRHVHTRHRYARGELRQKIESAGLALQRLTFVGLMLFPLAALKRLIQPEADSQTDVTLPVPAVNRTLTAALAAEGLWLRRFNLPIGLSLLALARKPSTDAPRQSPERSGVGWHVSINP